MEHVQCAEAKKKNSINDSHSDADIGMKELDSETDRQRQVEAVDNNNKDNEKGNSFVLLALANKFLQWQV